MSPESSVNPLRAESFCQLFSADPGFSLAGIVELGYTRELQTGRAFKYTDTGCIEILRKSPTLVYLICTLRGECPEDQREIRLHQLVVQFYHDRMKLTSHA